MRRLFGLILLPCFLSVVSCMKTSSSSEEEVGSVSFRVSIGLDSPFKKIAKSVELTISAQDMITMTKKLDIKDSTVEGTISGIPSGKNRLFEVKVYDSLGVARYKGSTSGNIIADSTINLPIEIVRISGSAIINGSIVEFPGGWSLSDNFEDSILNSKWKPYSKSVGSLTSSKAHFGSKSFEVTYSDFKFTFEKPISEGKISWWYYDNSGTPWSYFYILTDTSNSANLENTNLHVDTQNPSSYFFYHPSLPKAGITNVSRISGWRNFMATISKGEISISIDGQAGITVDETKPVIAFQVAGAIMDDFYVESVGN